MIAASIAPANAAESRVSPDEYRTLERQQREQRHEYDNGLQIPMTGSSYRHSQLITNLLVLLATALEESDYTVHASDLRVWIPQWAAGTYPDLLVIQGEPRFTADRTDEVLNPMRC
jgi:Uma2 family endonuclease